MKKQHLYILIGSVAIFLVALIAVFMRFTATPGTTAFIAPTEEPLDVVTTFYNSWVETLNSTSTTIEASGLLDADILSDEIKASVKKARKEMGENTPDPVTCQMAVPERMGGKVIFATTTSAEIMMLARGFEEKSPFQSIVTVEAVEGKWQITKIDCRNGEMAPEREFDFEREGFLLKNLPPPLNPNLWYLIYEENGKKGHTVPLTITPESICVQNDGNESPCEESMFSPAQKVYLRADMTEAGAIIRRIDLNL